MKKSFRLKVTFSFLIGILLCVIVLIAGCKLMLRPIFIFDTKHSMHGYAQLVGDAYTSGSFTVKRLLDMLDSSHDIQSFIFDEEIDVILNSGEEVFPGSYKIQQLSSWFDGYGQGETKNGVYCEEIYDGTDNLARVIFIKSIDESSFLCMSKVVRGVDQKVRIVTYVVTVMGLLISAIGVLIWSRLTRPFTKHMEKMSRVTRNMSQLNFEEKIDYHSNDEIGVLATSIDNMSNELKISIERLQKDVERRKRLIRDISHELKTPVTTIRGYTENIEYLSQDNEKIKGYCNIMIEECEVIDALINEMLYMSKLESDGYECRMEIIDSRELEKKIKARVSNEFGSTGIEISLEKAIICANEILTERAVFNYIANAVKYRFADTVITVSGRQEQDGYVFSVTNQGPEISPADREHIWDVFYKTDKSRTRENKGHGIGLAMVRQIALLHGGEVGVESKEGCNTFIFKIPEKIN